MSHVGGTFMPCFWILLGEKGSFIFKENPSMGGEDFSFFVENCKGAFFHVGCGNKEKRITSLIHTEDFDIDEYYREYNKYRDIPISDYPKKFKKYFKESWRKM